MATSPSNEFQPLLEHIQQRGPLPSVEDWLWLCALGDKLDARKEIPLTKIVKSLAANISGPREVHNAYRKLKRLAEKLNRPPFYDGEPGQGTIITAQGKTFLDQLKDVLRHLQRALLPNDFPCQIRVVARHEINTRYVPDLLERVRNYLRTEDTLEVERDMVGTDQDGKPLDLVDFDTDYDSSRGLLDRALRSGDDDLVLAFCDKDYRFPKGVKVAEAELPRCLLLPNNDSITPRLEEEKFSWSLLKGRTIFLPEDDLGLPDFPKHELDGVPNVTIRWVKTFPQAHAFVASKSGVTITHPDLLREHEELRSDAVVIDALGKTRLCAILCPQSLRRRPQGQQKVVCKIFDFIKQELDAKGSAFGSRPAGELAAKIRGSWYAWHTTLDGDKCYWSDRGSISLRYTPSAYLKGLHTPGISWPEYEVLGRMIETPGNPRQYQILLDGSAISPAHERDDLYSVSFIFDDKQLNSGTLVGTWIGQASLSVSREKPLQPGIGLMVIAREDIEPRLTELIEKQRQPLLTWKRPVGFLRHRRER